MDSETAAFQGGVALLERAVNYTLGSLRLVTPDGLDRPTPCAAWPLRTLLRHLDGSFAALHEAIAHRAIGPGDAEAAPTDLVGSLRERAARLLGAWAGASGEPAVAVAGWPVSASVVAGTGAIEIAVHGWDVARACEWHRPLPPSLATALLDLAPLLIGEADRPERFASPVPVPAEASPSDRLVAFLGRSPHRAAWLNVA